jgi:hypothetical protein
LPNEKRYEVTVLLSVNINDESEAVLQSCEARGITRANAISLGIDVLAMLEDAKEVRLVGKDGTIECF